MNRWSRDEQSQRVVDAVRMILGRAPLYGTDEPQVGVFYEREDPEVALGRSRSHWQDDEANAGLDTTSPFLHYRSR